MSRDARLQASQSHMLPKENRTKMYLLHLKTGGGIRIMTFIGKVYLLCSNAMIEESVSLLLKSNVFRDGNTVMLKISGVIKI